MMRLHPFAKKRLLRTDAALNRALRRTPRTARRNCASLCALPLAMQGKKVAGFNATVFAGFRLRRKCPGLVRPVRHRAAGNAPFARKPGLKPQTKENAPKNKAESFAKKNKKMFDTLQSVVHTYDTKICGGGLIEIRHRFKPGSHIERRV